MLDVTREPWVGPVRSIICIITWSIIPCIPKTFPIRDINVTLSWSMSPGSYEQRGCIRERCRKPSNALMFCMLETIRTPVLVLIFTVLGRQQTEGKGESSMRSSLYQWQFASIIIKIQGITESFHENLWSKYAIF